MGPFEFLVGEYNHLFVVWLVPCHAATILMFLICGGVLASLNHTRLDLQITRAFMTCGTTTCTTAGRGRTTASTRCSGIECLGGTGITRRRTCRRSRRPIVLLLNRA